MAASVADSSSSAVGSATPDDVKTAESPDLPKDAPGFIESMMHAYGYTQEAIDKENRMSRDAIEGLENNTGECACVRLIFMKVSNSFAFQALFGILILLNAIAMGFEADSEAGDMSDVYVTLENVFCTLFLIEVIIRCVGSPVPAWRDVYLMLDVLIVTISVFDNWFLSLTGLSKSNENQDAELDLSVLTVLRILRIARVARVFRAIALFRPIRVLMGSMAKAAQNLFWIALLLVVMFYCFGLTFRMMLGSVDTTSEVQSVVKKHFSSVGNCIMTSIEVLLRGFDWTDQITAPLLNNPESMAAGVIWLLFVSSVHVCVANLIVGVFVEQLLSTARESDEQVYKENLVMKVVNIRDIKRAFCEMDTNETGWITQLDFKNGIRQNPELAWMIGIAPEEADLFLQSQDLFGHEDINIDDLIFAVIKLKGGTKSVDMMCVDYQIKQIIKQVQGTPTQIEELSRQLAKFELRLESLYDEMQRNKNSCVVALESVPKRLRALEDQMSNFMTRMQVPQNNAKQQQQPAFNAGNGMSIANLRGSYQLADEMRELRRVMELATGVNQPR